MPVPAKPSTPKAWATDGGAKLGVVGSAKMLAGLIGGIIPDAIWNKILQDIYKWIDVTDLHTSSYDTIEDAIDGMSEHGYAMVDVDPSTQYPGYTTGDLTGDRIIAIDTDGKYAYLVRFDGTVTYTVERRALSDWSTVDETYTLSGTPDGSNPVRAISTDGKHLGVCWGTTFDIFDVEDGSTQVFSNVTSTAPPSDCYLAGDQAHLFLKDGGVASSLVASYSLTTYTAIGVETPSANSTNDGAICSDGQYVYVAHHDGTDTVLDVIAYDMSAILHTTTWANDFVQPRSICCNGQYVAVGVNDTSNTARVFAIQHNGSASDVSLVQVGQVDAGTIGYSLCMTHDQLVISTSEGTDAHIYVHSLPGLELIAEFEQEPQSNNGENDICTDGVNIYYPTSNASRRVAATCLGLPATQWRKCNGDEPYRRPFHNLLIPSK